MAKDRTLKAALERHKGVDHKLEHQKKLQKQAEKRKRQRRESDLDVSMAKKVVINGDDKEIASPNTLSSRQLQEEQLAADAAEKLDVVDGEGEGWETDGSEDAEDGEDLGVDVEALDDESDSDEESVIFEAAEDQPAANGGEDEDEEDEEDGEEIPLSDIESLASEDKGDIIPHQRLTINNTAALQRSLKSFALHSGLPFSATQSVTSAEPVEIKDVDDDLNRELSFYKQSLDAVKEARALLKKESVPFSRPRDYFAEMVKSEEQMGKVRQKVLDETARKKASQDAKRQRDLKKFGKAVQVAKMQERDKAKRDTLEKINVLKRKRQGADMNTNEDDMFDVALEDAAVTAKKDKAAKRAGTNGAGPNRKRQKKDERFGFGGKKRHAKSNDAQSSGDMKGYSVKKMKAGGGKGGKARPGKNPTTKKYADEGHGKSIVQSRRELKILGNYGKTFGLRELRAKINANASFTPSLSGLEIIRLSPCVDSCYGTFAVEITRKYLDSGPLAEELAALTTPNSLRGHTTRRKLVTLAAGVMILDGAI